ncbi:MAG: 3-hydroxyacyl-CoA dehydrogenase family protein [Patulibacter sp.]|nr:3-hydroxyacyl-CoA dehydrogenase family protein [Patulibacter sp.]
MTETVAVAGSGTIACGIAVTAARTSDVILLARSEASADRARASIDKQVGKLDVDVSGVTVTTDPQELTRATYVIEAVSEDPATKVGVFAQLLEHAPADAILATTTSSLSIEELAQGAGAAERFVGLHVFNPVTKMELIELIFPSTASDTTKERSRALAAAWGKTAVEMPDMPGFVVNKLLFPFLFEAVRLKEQSGLSAKDIDTCMQLGAGQPMGPFALLDFVGLDVSKAIGEVIGADVPQAVDDLVAEGKLGRKTGEGFLDWRR